MAAVKPRKYRFGSMLPVVLVLVLLLCGCARHVTAPISDRNVVGPDRISSHWVSKGETLYSIAWRYGLEHRKLATANGIGAPYLIHPGQRLTLDLSNPVKAVTPRVAAKSRPANPPAVNAQSTSKPSSSSTVRPAQPAVARRTAPPAATTAKQWRWQWPLKGKLVRYYDSDKRFKGVYLHRSQGAPVVAAAPGEVVYAGNGLPTYGPSIIIKHSDTYLSFYALNRKLSVKEGDRVAAGQKIAEVGGDVNDRNRIYFEIRRNGHSTDPIRLLPRQ